MYENITNGFQEKVVPNFECKANFIQNFFNFFAFIKFKTFLGMFKF